jgi:Cu/Ag efflux pump CusA
MMRFIVSKSVQFRFLVLAMACALMYFGMRELRNARVDVFPEFAPPRVEIQVPSVGLSAKEVEELVTIPIEDALNGGRGPRRDAFEIGAVARRDQLDLQVGHRSAEGASAGRRTVVGRGADLAVLDKPAGAHAGPILDQPLHEDRDRSDTLSLRDLSMISYWKIRARLLRVAGVSNVMIYGERIKMYAVQVEPEKLVRHKVALTTVHETIGDALDASLVRFSDGHWIGSGGFIDTPNQRLQLRYVLPIVTPDDLSKVTLKDRPDLRLTDVARVVEDNPPLIGDASSMTVRASCSSWRNFLGPTRSM